MIYLKYGGNSIPIKELEIGVGLFVSELDDGRLELTTEETDYGGQPIGLKALYMGFGSPEGVVAAPSAAIYLQRDELHDNPIWVKLGRPDVTQYTTDTFSVTDTDINGKTLTSVGTFAKNPAFPSGQINSASGSAYNAISGDSLYTVAGLSLPGPDYEVKVTFNRVTTGAGSSTYIGVGCRASDTDDSGYRVEFRLDGWISLYRQESGSYDLLTEVFLTQPALGTGTLAIRAVGDIIYVLYNGYQVLAWKDTTFTATGRPSLYMWGSSSSGTIYRIEDFTVSTLVETGNAVGWRRIYEGVNEYGIQIGWQAVAEDWGSVAIGVQAYAMGRPSDFAYGGVAVGNSSWAHEFGASLGGSARSGSNGVAVGYGSSSYRGAFAIAIGGFASAAAADAIVIGDSASAGTAAEDSICIGVSAQTSFAETVMIGVNPTANAAHQIKIAGRLGAYYNEFLIGEDDRFNNTVYYTPTGRETKMDDLKWRMARAVEVGSTTASAWSNLPGGDFTFEGSRGTGTGAGGKFIVRLGKAGATATTIHDLETVLQLDGKGNVGAGKQAALATTATDGFLYVPNCPGVPTGVPTGITGMIPLVVDTTNSRLYAYISGAWVQL